MKEISSLWRNRYLRTVGSLLIAAVLIAAIGSCTPTPPGEYELTMTVNPTEGGTAADETGTSPYAQNETVEVKAVPAPCYRFISWTAPAGVFGDPIAAETTFTMPAEDVTVTANFGLTPPDHFKVYWTEGGLPIGEEVLLEDQFTSSWLEEPLIATVLEPVLFANPAGKWHGEVLTPIWNPDNHLTFYWLDYDEVAPVWYADIDNQFGSQELWVGGPLFLAVPTRKGPHDPPSNIDHYLVYEVLDYAGGPVEPPMLGLHDQWMEQETSLHSPALFANPVKKTHGSAVTLIDNPDDHLLFYWVDGGDFFMPELAIGNQFGPQLLPVVYQEMSDLLGVPSLKIEWGLAI